MEISRLIPKPLVLLLLAILSSLQPIRCQAASIPDSSTDKNWEELRSAIEAGDEKKAATFIGKRISLIAGREGTTPNLTLTAHIIGKRWITITVIQPKPSSPAYWSIRQVQRWTAALVDVGILGKVRSIDLEKGEIVLDPIRGWVSAAT